MQAILGASKVDASATFKVQMIRYENPSSKNYDGSCCDLFCWSHCDHVFRFALDVGNRCVIQIVGCPVTTLSVSLFLLRAHLLPLLTHHSHHS